MRALPAFLLVAVLANAACAGRSVDLTVPGALDALRTENPTHYAKVRAIISAAEARPNSDIGSWIRTEFKASDVEYLPLWHVTDPPKTTLVFTLDNTRYTVVVVGRFEAAPPPPKR